MSYISEPKLSSDRFEALDGLRGLAAISVAIYHICHPYFRQQWDPLNMDPMQRRLYFWAPVSFVWDGDASVILFFVLSGFVLSLPYYAGKQLAYPKYFIRRICRIYVPYIVAVAVGLILYTLLYRGRLEQYPLRDKILWGEPITMRSLFDHLCLITSSDQRIDPVTWSLTYEMRMSLLFPVLMLGIVRLRFVPVFFISLILAETGFLLHERFEDTLPVLADLVYTLRSLVPFVMGALVAKNRGVLALACKRGGRFFLGALGLVGLMIYNYHWVPELLLKRYLPELQNLVDLMMISIGSGILIVWILASESATKLLTLPLPQFLGKISYSFYLYHLLVMLGLMHSLGTLLSVPLVLSASFVLSFPVAMLMYELVEKPSMKLGRRLTSRSISQSRPDVQVG